jgi:DNA helicase-2/ATP-dependent DNA helicase PcrA
MADHPALAQAATAWLGDHRASLVGDLPRRVEAGMRAGDYAERRFDHVIVDEFQDLTETEARLATGLRANDGYLVALGDRKQSIYAFRGNEGRGLAALEEFVGEPVTDHVMDECRRCRTEIVNLANSVMAYYDEPLRDVRGPGAELHEVFFPTPEAEHQRMAAEIVRQFRARPNARHLVLVTRRKWGYDLRAAIAEADPEINAQTAFSEDILETWPVREAFMLLSSIANPVDPVTHRDWIAYKRPDATGRDWKAPRRHAPVYVGLRAGGLLSAERLQAVAAADVNALNGTGRGEVHRRATRLRDLLADLPDNADAGDLVEAVLDPNKWVSQDEPPGALPRQDLDRLRGEALRMLDEADAVMGLDELVARLRNRIASREPIGLEESPDIKIVTLWGAKGLTADFTYLIGLCDEALPGRYDPDTSGLEEGEHFLEQLRLLYVSLTRAKRALVISRPTKIRRGEVPALGLQRTNDRNNWWQYLHRCRFLDDLPRDVLPEPADGEQWDGLGVDR